MNTLKDLAARLQQPDGGFTVHPYFYEDVAGGYAVSINPEATHVAETVSVENLFWYVVKRGNHFVDTSKYLGGWNDPETGLIHLDVSTIVSTAREAHDLCIKHNQISYYDFAAGKSVKVKADPVAPFDMLSFVMAWEEGDCDLDEEIAGFQSMINTGIVWQLQGMYGRRAAQLINDGSCVLPG